MVNRVNMDKKYKKAFDLEYFRDSLAKKESLKKFRNTYRKGNSEIPNTNSGKKWDRLNIGILQENNPMAFDRVNSLLKYISGRDLKILDYGFGQGAFEEKLFRTGKCTNLIGIDISAESVRKAKKKFKEWDFFKGDINKIKEYKNLFDYIVCSEVLEHISPSKTFSILERFHKSLKRKGFLLISVPLNEGLEEMIERGENPNFHTRIYTSEIIKTELQIAGFKLIKSEFLYAFHNQYYFRKFLTNLLFREIKKPNVIIILSQKP